VSDWVSVMLAQPESMAAARTAQLREVVVSLFMEILLGKNWVMSLLKCVDEFSSGFNHAGIKSPVCEY